MKKLILAFVLALLGLTLFVYILPAHADRLTPKEIENEVRYIAWGRNLVTDASHMEEEYGIKLFKDGKWNCCDRAEVAKRLAEQNGYRAVYRWNKKHMWLCIIDNGEKVEILK